MLVKPARKNQLFPELFKSFQTTELLSDDSKACRTPACRTRKVKTWDTCVQFFTLKSIHHSDTLMDAR